MVYVMRHPVDRLVSHYIHEWSMGNLSCGIDEAVEHAINAPDPSPEDAVTDLYA